MLVGSKVRLRDKRLADAAGDHAWQVDPELAQLDAVPVLPITFSEYQSSYANELRYPSLVRCRFAIETLDGKHIGNCAYYGVNEAAGETELGIMVGNRDYWDKGYGTDAITTLVSYIFRQIKLKRVHLKTLDSNVRAQKCFEKCGFTPCGHLLKDGFSFMRMEITREQWEKRQTK